MPNENSQEPDLRLKHFYPLDDRDGGNVKIPITLASLRDGLEQGAQLTALKRCMEFCQNAYIGPDEETEETSTEPDDDQDEDYEPSIGSGNEQDEDHVSPTESDDKEDKDYMPCSENDVKKLLGKHKVQVVVKERDDH